MLARAESENGEPAATPYRPSISTPATLSSPGWIEIETGFLHEHNLDGARRDSLPTTVKLAFSPDWGIRIGGDAWVREHGGGTQGSGIGDTSIVLKRRFEIDDAQAFGLEAQATLPTSHNGLGTGSGKADYGINAIYSVDFGGTWHSDLNLVGTRLGNPGEGASRAQWLWAASLSRAITDRWGVVGELSGTTQRGGEDTSQFLAALTCNVTKRLTLDAGASRSIRSGPPVWTAFTGLTWLAARLF